MAKIAVLGHGVVGSGVLEVLLTHHDSIERRAKEEISVKRILDLREFPGLPYSDIFTKDFSLILNDPEIAIVVEVMGGITPAYDYVKACLNNGKSVVTSNKELVAAKGAELIALAQKNNLNFLFEASCRIINHSMQHLFELLCMLGRTQMLIKTHRRRDRIRLTVP